jgi:signal transduction histidine kinase
LAHKRSKLIEAQEEERTRIARELHDDFCRRLAMLSVKMEKLRNARRTSKPPLVDAQLDNVRQECADLASDIQQMSHEREVSAWCWVRRRQR